MIKKFIHKLPIIWKQIWLLIIGIIITTTLISFFYHSIITFLSAYDFLELDALAFIKNKLIQLFIIILIIWSLLFLIIYFDFTAFTKRINMSLKEALTERKLELNFINYYTGQSWNDIILGIQSFFSLIKSFDNMKAAKISAETNSTKVLIDNINIGVIFVNKERIVTHINHICETILKLIPGEIINQTISRKISLDFILDNLEQAFEKDKKITEVNFQLKEKQLSLSIYPVKNKFGEIFRAMILIENLSEQITINIPKSK
jgi:hypothetical protein